MRPKTNLPRSVKPWPCQWDLHILNTCDFYFDEKDKKTSLDFINGASFSSCVVSAYTSETDIASQDSITGLEVRLLFKIFESNYGAILKYMGNNFIQGMVFHLVRTIIDISDIINNTIPVPKGCQLIQADHSLLIVQGVENLKSCSAYECISKIDKIISGDYGSRGKGNGDSDPVDNPPDCPDDSLSLDPTLIAA